MFFVATQVWAQEEPLHNWEYRKPISGEYWLAMDVTHIIPKRYRIFFLSIKYCVWIFASGFWELALEIHNLFVIIFGLMKLSLRAGDFQHSQLPCLSCGKSPRLRSTRFQYQFSRNQWVNFWTFEVSHFGFFEFLILIFLF